MLPKELILVTHFRIEKVDSVIDFPIYGQFHQKEIMKPKIKITDIPKTSDIYLKLLKNTKNSKRS
jgi:hypothetical protein